MNGSAPLAERQREELANAASHGVGFLLALASVPAFAADVASAGMLVFVGSMQLTYLASALYHAAPHGPAKAWLRRVDHATIFVFIAGTCTPFATGSAHGWAAMTVVWSLALAGAVLKLRDRLRDRYASVGAYAACGWIGLAAVGPRLAEAADHSLAWWLAGAAAYSVGTVFYLLDSRLRFGHFTWHLFALGGSACHFVAVLR